MEGTDVTLCKLTKLLPAGTTIYINPAHVITLETVNGHTVIETTGTGKNGSEHLTVMETLDKAAEALDVASMAQPLFMQSTNMSGRLSRGFLT